jgi:hypothetical protein
MNKVFCVGIWKSGTKSICEALRLLGYRDRREFWNIMPDANTKSIHELHDINEWKSYLDTIYQETKKFDAFSDTPWHFVYKSLYEWYPTAKFILTLRSSAEAFADSQIYHCKWHHVPKDKIHSEAYFVNQYNEHNKYVRDFFKDKELLEMKIEDNNWHDLCKFLKKSVPPYSFPHFNKRQEGVR